MRNRVILALLGLTIPSSAAVRTSAVPLSQSSERDVQCFTLALVAAGGEKDPARRQTAVAGVWYFLGRIDSEAPGIDLKRNADRAFARMRRTRGTMDIAAACDAQFRKRGADLVRLGHSSGH